MGLVATGLAHQEEIEDRISRLAKLFPDDVSRIDYRLGEDWSGDSSLFLSVHLTPAGASEERFPKLIENFQLALLMEVSSEELGFHSYFDFVSDPGL